MNTLYDKLIEKSQEAFLLAIEVYNKPTIKYRVEGFSFFMCNAWELMLKAHLINVSGENSIYYKDNPDRTLSLENCISTVFTNDKDPLRINLKKICELRNISTHLVTSEYEMVYIPLFQACVFNFVEKMEAFHNIDITNIVAYNFLNLSVSLDTFDEDVIKAKYPENLANKLIGINEEIAPLIKNNNSNFAVRIQHEYYITKNKDAATAIVKIDNNSEIGIKIVKELKDPKVTHKYTAKKVKEKINKLLEKKGISLQINNADFQNFCRYYDIKNNTKFCYIDNLYPQPRYSYSQATIDFIFKEIEKDPENILVTIKNKSTPGAKEF